MRTRGRCLGLVLAPLIAMPAIADISVEKAWVRLLPPMVKTSAAYMKIHTTEADSLLSASSPNVNLVELHQSRMEKGVMSMGHVGRMDMAAGDTLVLKPSAYHLMLMGLKAPLKEGDIYRLTLTFEKAGSVELDLPVRRDAP